jgi:radical SAM protein with 4Fe4S-binding SPASM domain
MGNQYVEMGLSAPVNVTWEVTYACNLSCIDCLSDSGRRRKGWLTTEQALQVIDQLAAVKVFQFNIGGGEPFMRPDFLDLMDHAHHKGMVTCISTNGTLIDERIARRLDHPLVYVQVSLDGATEASNDAIRGRGSYAKVMKALDHLRKRDIEVSMNCVLTRRSYPELYKLEDFGTVWNTSSVFDSFRQLEIKSCESCHRFDMCHGGCPAIAYRTQRTLGLPDPGCLANCVTMKTVMKEAV